MRLPPTVEHLDWIGIDRLESFKAEAARNVRILSYNPGHDGAVAFLQDGRLMVSIEAEKDSNYRYSPVSSADVFNALGDLDEIPDVICTGGWWPRDHYEYLHGSDVHVGYRGVSKSDVIVGQRRFLGKQVHYFSSSHERSHLLCAFGMSNLPKGTPCYALVWEGAIGAFYEIDSELNITLVADVLNQPGNRYGLLYGLADPTFPKNGQPRFGSRKTHGTGVVFESQHPFSSRKETARFSVGRPVPGTERL